MILNKLNKHFQKKFLNLRILIKYNAKPIVTMIGKIHFKHNIFIYIQNK